jgi:hypothetical protein
MASLNRLESGTLKEDEKGEKENDEGVDSEKSEGMPPMLRRRSSVTISTAIFGHQQSKEEKKAEKKKELEERIKRRDSKVSIACSRFLRLASFARPALMHTFLRLATPRHHSEICQCCQRRTWRWTPSSKLAIDGVF